MYNPSDKEKQTIKRVYEELSLMKKLRNQKWKHFNDRSLKDFIDDSQLRLNGYVPSRKSQGKEPWQSNMVHPVTRNKFKAILAGYSLGIPETRIVAQNEKQQEDQNRAKLMRSLVNYSYDTENKEEQNFFEAWEACEKGTVITYDGYLRAKAKRKVIKSFDPTTGEVETEEEEVETDNQCVGFIVPLMNLYIKDWTIFDIQKQPALAWVERMDVDSFENEFGKYKKFGFVKKSNQLTDKNENDLFFKEYWQERDKNDEPIEVVRYFNKGKDEFIILANGVLLFEAPMLLGKKKKWYPFAKTVFEPFASDFFYGNSLPNSLMCEQDVINTLYNMTLDKTYRSMVPPLLIGMPNKDDFDLEDQNISSDTKIYVQDINQVREMQISGINTGELQMIQLISRGLDQSSVDENQGGTAGRGVTAREVVIADQNAKRLKGILYMFMTSLWMQKIKLRTMNILTFYTQEKIGRALGEDSGKAFSTFMVQGEELSNGQKGTLGIRFVKNQKDLPSPAALDVEEEREEKRSGKQVEIVAMTADFLDDWVYDVKIESESLYQQDENLTQTKMEEKLRMLGTYSPQTIMVNQEKVARDILMAHGDEPDEYDFTPPAPVGMPGEEAVEPGAEQATAGQAGLPPV